MITFYNFQAMVETSPDVYVTDPNGNPSYLNRILDNEKATFEIVPDNDMIPGYEHVIQVSAEAAFISGLTSISPEDKLVGQSIEKYFKINLYEIWTPIEIQDQQYTLDGSSLVV